MQKYVEISALKPFFSLINYFRRIIFESILCSFCKRYNFVATERITNIEMMNIFIKQMMVVKKKIPVEKTCNEASNFCRLLILKIIEKKFYNFWICFLNFLLAQKSLLRKQSILLQHVEKSVPMHAIPFCPSKVKILIRKAQFFLNAFYQIHKIIKFFPIFQRIFLKNKKIFKKIPTIGCLEFFLNCIFF